LGKADPGTEIQSERGKKKKDPSMFRGKRGGGGGGGGRGLGNS